MFVLKLDMPRIILILFTLSGASRAADFSELKIREAGAVTENTAQMEDAIVRETTKLVADTLEGTEEIKTFQGRIREWVRTFNFKQLYFNAKRLYDLKSADPKLRDSVQDLVFMLGASHVVESTSSVWGTGLANALGASQGLQWLIGAAGVVITIPGLDPLCIGLLAAYPASKKFRGIVRQARLSVFKVAMKAWEISHFGVILRRVSTWMKAYQAESYSELEIERVSRGMRRVRLTRPELTLTWIEETSGAYLERVEVARGISKIPPLGLGANLQAAVDEVVKSKGELGRNFYMRSISPNFQTVEYEPHAIRLSPVTRGMCQAMF